MTVRYAFCHDQDAKQRAHATAKKHLRKVAKCLGVTLQPGDVRTNPGGPIIWGESMLHTDTLYVQVDPSREHVLVRTVTSRRDYTGGRNCYIQLALLSKPEEFAARLRATLGL